MTPVERLIAARQTAKAGCHDEALREFVWFHHHALDVDPSLSGVRRSYALSDWAKLAKDYPPARVALEQIREEHTKAALSDTGDLDAFRDVESINRYLDSSEHTHDLFAAVAAANPALAQRCARYALAAVVAAGDFSLAMGFLQEPERYVRSIAEKLHEDLLDDESDPLRKKHRAMAHGCNYIGDIRPILAAFSGVGLLQERAKLSELASMLARDTQVRELVEDGLAATDSAMLDGTWLMRQLDRAGLLS